MKVAIVGVGKVGKGLHRALRAARVPCSIVSARAFVERPQRLRGDVVIVAARDGAIGRVAEAIVASGKLDRTAVVVHCAGALDAEVLAPLRPVCAGVAQMHPMISFADPARPPTLGGGHAHVAGDPEAERRAKALCRAIGLVPRTFPGLDRVAYHAAAGLVANGAAALAAAGADLLRRAGATDAAIPAMLGPLLRSVAENVEVMGLPDALTGPVRRGDAAGVQKHLATLRSKAPHLVPIYVACAKAQLPLARALGDAPADAFDAVEKALEP
ncbi:MAG: DUF2520 domain-containing protein [Deltaproteobacteria bacterium]|nr:DUF2520 domain-containing protein [Deltaproteobacteria bacterium]